MSGLIGNAVSLEGFYSPDSTFTFNVTDAGGAAANPATAPSGVGVSQAVSLDVAAANSVQLSGAGLPVLGPLMSLETRGLEGIKVGAVALKGGYRFAYTGSLAVGNSITGSATAGKIAVAAAIAPSAVTGVFDNRTLVTEVDAGTNTAVVLFL